MINILHIVFNNRNSLIFSLKDLIKNNSYYDKYKYYLI